MKKRKWMLIVFLMGLVGVFGDVIAQEKRVSLEVKSKIDRVMAYKDRALVTRQAQITNLQPGIYEVVLKELPVMIQDASVRAVSIDTANVKILDVGVKTYQLENPSEDKIKKLQDELQKLQDETRGVDDTLRLLKNEKQYLNTTQSTFFKSAVPPTGSSKDNPALPRLTIKDYEDMLKFLTGKLDANAKSIQREEIRRRDIHKKMALLREEMNKLGVRQYSVLRKKSVEVTVEVLKQGSYTIEVSYINYNVSWRPSYDVRVLEDSKEMEVIGYGVVSQKSGEDWNNVTMSYSTAQPALQGWLPEIKPLYATLSVEVPAQTITARKMREAKKEQSKLNWEMLEQQQEVFTQGQIMLDKQLNDKVSGGEVQPEHSAYLPSEAVSRVGSVVFHTPKKSDIVADGTPHRTAISQEKLPIEFEYITCPKVSPHVYLQVLGSNTMDAPLLRGSLNVFMGTDFVGPSFSSGILPTEEFELTLNVDENIRVSRKLEDKGEKGPKFLGKKKRVTYHFLIKIENYKKEEAIVTVIDQIPVSQHKDVKIEKHEFSDEPEEEEKDGRLTWKFKLAPKETKELRFSFHVFVPKDKDPAFYNDILTMIQTRTENYRDGFSSNYAPAPAGNEMRRRKK